MPAARPATTITVILMKISFLRIGSVVVAVTHARFATDPKTFAATIPLTTAAVAKSEEKSHGHTEPPAWL